MPYKDRSKLYEAQKRHRVRIRARLFEFLSNNHCIDCGEKDPIVLDFDHKDPHTKYRSVSKLLSGHWSWNSVEREMLKCDVRCANCHRRKTYTQQNGWGKTKPNNKVRI